MTGATGLRETEAALRKLLLAAEPVLLDGISDKRQLLARRLVRNHLRGAIVRAAPHALRLSGRDAFDVMVDRFLAHSPPTTRMVREIPIEFARFVMTLAPADLPHASFAELVHWETVEIEVMLAADRAPREEDGVPVADPSARLCAYRFDVTSVDERSTTWPRLREAADLLVVWRFRDALRFRRISGGTARVLVAVGGGLSWADARAAMLRDAGPTLAPVAAVVDDELTALQAEGALWMSNQTQETP